MTGPTYRPGTTEGVGERYLARMLEGADALEHIIGAPVYGVPEADLPEIQQFRREAVAGARAYAAVFREFLAAGEVQHRHLTRADLVARAIQMNGWLSAGAVNGSSSERPAMRTLVDAGVFEYVDQVPGRWFARYRLIAPDPSGEAR
jgi:hypothetical protein